MLYPEENLYMEDTMDPETISMLCNPNTREPLEMKMEQKQGGAEQQFLVDMKTGERFPFRNGIPVLFDVSRLEGYNLQYSTFYYKAARFYDAALSTLALFYGSRETKFRNQYLRLLEIQKDSKVLEVSVGTGTNISLLPEVARCYGLDLSWEMLFQCQKNLLRWNRKGELFFGNAELLPFRDAMFDVVFHVGGINAFSDRAKAISEMIRVARPGTRIVIVDETAKMMKSLSWIPSARKMVAEWGDRFEPPVNLVPATMREIQVETIVKDYFYILSFRKP
jgi:ubiquinone/menaquinone biosynthesis C-methylase UbiE/uncharacterized protein YbaR (Trm112 family)